MPFPMTHLCVARSIALAARPQNPAQFMLGATAPDAVHERPNFTARDKYVSHLCVGERPWGEIQDNGAWRANVLAFLAGHPDDDFYRGYCAHILTDALWNERFYQPLKAAHPEEFAGRWSSPFHKACSDVDVRLYEASGDEGIWALLRAARPLDVPGRVTAAEIEAERQGLLAKYQSETLTGVQVQSAVTLPAVQDFIAEAAASIARDLFA